MLSLIQAYRGFAALLVVLFHAGVATRAYFGDDPALHVFGFGGAGVQFFFVLSGFIIYYVHRGDIDRPQRLGAYVRKRLIRIYPLYWIVTLALAPFWLLIPHFGEPYHKDVGALLASLLLLPQPHDPHLTVAWTLVQEMLFYALFATLLISKRLGFALLGTWFASIAVVNAIDVELAFPLGYLLALNNLLFGLGLLAGWLTTAIRLRAGWRCFAFGNLVFLITGLLVNTGYQGSFTVIAFGVASFAIMLSAVTLDSWFRRPVFGLLGDASYAIYLLHYPAISLLCKLLPALPSGVAFITLAALSALAGIALHLLVERPVQALLKERLLPRRASVTEPAG